MPCPFPDSFTEEPFALPTPDDKKIYGVFNKSKTPNGKVVILSHGLTDYLGNYMHVIARNVFTAQGYDVVRFNYYTTPDDARKLDECTIETHAADLNLICDHFRPSYTKLFIAGHSYGGLSMIYANPEAQALAFWDSSFFPYATFWKDEAPRLDDTAYHICGWGCHNLINPAMIAFDKAQEPDGVIARAHAIKTPSLVALAGESQENPVRTILFDSLLCARKLVDIQDANHTFSNGHTLFTLLDETVAWFNQY